MKRIALIIAVIAAFAAAPAVAHAQTDGYGDVAGATQDSSGGSTGSSSSPAPVATTSGDSDSGILPFTGLELALMFGSGVVLLGTGLLLRRTRSE